MTNHKFTNRSLANSDFTLNLTWQKRYPFKAIHINFLKRIKNIESLLSKIVICFRISNEIKQCILITFIILIKACFSNKTCIVLIQTKTTKLKTFQFSKTCFDRILKVIGVWDQLCISFTFGTALASSKILKVRNPTRISNL